MKKYVVKQRLNRYKIYNLEQDVQGPVDLPLLFCLLSLLTNSSPLPSFILQGYFDNVKKGVGLNKFFSTSSDILLIHLQTSIFRKSYIFVFIGDFCSCKLLE